MVGTARSFEDAVPALFAIAYRVAFRLSGDREMSEDIAQEIGARALVRWSKVEPYAEAWVARSAGNLALDQVRRRRWHQTEPCTSPEVTPERLDVVQALRALPRRQREVVILRFVADLSEQQVADRLGCSVGAVKQHTHRALAALRASSTLTFLEGA
jgi:RNA polymerase sigma factor (sigma-70 family)